MQKNNNFKIKNKLTEYIKIFSLLSILIGLFSLFGYTFFATTLPNILLYTALLEILLPIIYRYHIKTNKYLFIFIWLIILYLLIFGSIFIYNLQNNYQPGLIGTIVSFIFLLIEIIYLMLILVDNKNLFKNKINSE